jgi:hypothetical protein
MAEDTEKTGKTEKEKTEDAPTEDAASEETATAEAPTADDENTVVEAAEEVKEAPIAAKAARTAQSEESESIFKLAPSSDGLFDQDIIDEKAGANYVLTRLMELRRSTIGLFIFVLACLGIIGLVSAAFIQPEWREDMKHVFACVKNAQGECTSLETHKLREKKRLKKVAETEDAESRNRYGGVTLVYFPPTARVTITQTVYEQDGLTGAPRKVAEKAFSLGARCDLIGAECPETGECAQKGYTCRALPSGQKACMKRDPEVCLPSAKVKSQRSRFMSEAKGKGLAKADAEKEADTRLAAWKTQQSASLCGSNGYCPNPTVGLGEGESITSLPINGIPLFEATKITDEKNPRRGAVDKVRTYAYTLSFSLDGYEPATKQWPRFRTNNQRLWTMVADGYRMVWKGLDLQPNMETLKKNFTKFKREFNCYLLKNSVPATTYRDMKDPHSGVLEKMYLKAFFKTMDKLEEVEQALTQGALTAQWWKDEWVKIQAETAKDEACQPDKKKGKR